MNRATLVILSLLGVSLLAQDPDSDLLRSLTKSVPQLPVDRVELKTSPPMTFEGISAVTADKQGNIYVIHRPADGDPVVVLDPQGEVLRSLSGCCSVRGSSEEPGWGRLDMAKLLSDRGASPTLPQEHTLFQRASQ